MEIQYTRSLYIKWDGASRRLVMRYLSYSNCEVHSGPDSDSLGQGFVITALVGLVIATAILQLGHPAPSQNGPDSVKAAREAGGFYVRPAMARGRDL